MDQSRVCVVGPLAIYRDGFGGELSGQGYTPGSASLQLAADGARESLVGEPGADSG